MPLTEFQKTFLGADLVTKEQVIDTDTGDPVDWDELGGGIDSGTAFPGAPVNNDLFFRIDRGLLYFYDGTRWLTTHLYIEKLGSWNNVSASSGQDSWSVPPTALGYDIWIEDLIATMEAASLSGTAFWTISLGKRDGATNTTLASVSNVSNTSSAMVQEVAIVDALLGVGVEALFAALTKTSTPGNLFAAAAITYRVVG